MKIIVCIKQILDPRGLTVNRKAEKVFVNREEYVIDPASKAALEVAESIKSARDEVIAISIGLPRVDEVLREAIGRGADRSILIRSDEQLDSFVVANLLAAAIEKIGEVDLVLCGDRSMDTGCGEVASRVAEALNLPSILNAAKIEIKENSLTATVYQISARSGVPAGAVGEDADGSNFVVFESQLPAVVSIMAEAFRGTYANAWRLIDAYKKMDVEIWNANDLGMSEEDLKPRSIKKEDAFPPERQLGTKVRNAKELIATLKRERIIA
jgi:electron transfer flavoprotein beta subunit